MVLLRDTTIPDINLGSGQFVSVNHPDFPDVNQDNDSSDPLPSFEFYYPPSSSSSRGWEAGVVWADAITEIPPIDPDSTGAYDITIHTLLSNNAKAWVQEKIKISLLDFGDLPEDYGTLLVDDGPVHTASALRLGVQVDGEPDGLPNTNSTLDNLTDRDDEDGVEPVGNWLLPSSPVISYTVNGCPNGCYLNMWVDWDGDFTTPTLDQVITNEPVSDGAGQLLYFSRPPGTPFSENINVRVRLCATDVGCATPFSDPAAAIPLGEVEDYRWSFEPTAVTINSFSATPTQNTTIVFIVAGIVTLIVLTGTIILYSRRKNQEMYS